MVKMIDDYINYFIENGNRSLLARIYGVFSIKTAYFSPVDIIVMQNTFRQFDKKGLKYKFDLKGSSIHRRSKCQMSKLEKLITKLEKSEGDPFSYQ